MERNINTPEVASHVSAAQKLRESSNVNEARIAANKAAEASAAAAAQPQVVPPVADPNAMSAPIVTNLTFEDRLRDRYEKELAEEKRKEQERLERERLGHGIADIAASIGDIIRASEGAPVNPRDWQRIYDSLTAQEKANVNNYQVRMAKLREDARADRKAAAAAQAQAQAAKQQRDYDYWKMMIERDDKLSEAEKNRMLQWLLGTMRADAQVEAAKQRIKTRGSSSQYIPVMLGNTTYQIPKGEAFGNYVRSVVNILNNPDSYLPEKEHSASLLEDQTLSTDPDSYYKRNVVGVIRNYWDDLTEPAQRAIEATIYGHGGLKGNVAPHDNGWDGEEYDDQ